MRVDLDAVTLQAKAAWRANARLREEFVGNEAAYLAGCRAEADGRVRVLRATVIQHAKATPDEQLTLAAPVAFRTGELVTLSGSNRGHVAGWGALYGGAPNRKNLRLMVGAFNEAKAPLVMLWAHDGDRPIGSWRRLVSDGRGLYAEGELNLNVAAGRDAFELLSGNDISGLSVGFRVPHGGAAVVDSVLQVTKADLMELSICSVPAEDRARVTTVRGA